MGLRSLVYPPPDHVRYGADDGTRTRNLLFTKQLLYQLSYVGATRRVIPQMTPSAPGNDRAARSDGSSVGVQALGGDIAGAIARAYAALDRIAFPGMHARRDIGHRAVGRP